MDIHGNLIAVEGCSRCSCGAKYWEYDICVSCGKSLFIPFRVEEQVDFFLFTATMAGNDKVNISDIVKAVYV